MIKLIVKEYCHNCPNFNPHVVKTNITYGFSDKIIYETYVYCKHREACESIYESIKKEFNK